MNPSTTRPMAAITTFLEEARMSLPAYWRQALASRRRRRPSAKLFSIDEKVADVRLCGAKNWKEASGQRDGRKNYKRYCYRSEINDGGAINKISKNAERGE